jgi:guanine deaminase
VLSPTEIRLLKTAPARVPSSFVAPPTSVNAIRRHRPYSRYNRFVAADQSIQAAVLTCMILSGHLLLTDVARSARLGPGWLRIDRGSIVEVHHGPCRQAVDLGGDDYLITPGFIDTHLHLPQFGMIGIDGLPLLEWLEQVIFPAEARWADSSIAAKQTENVLQQLLSFGTTSFCAYATVHQAASLAAFDVIHQHNVRACVGQVLMDRNAPPDLIRPLHEQLVETSLLLERFPHDPLRRQSRVEAAVTPRFAVTSSPELLRGAANLAKPHATIIQTHLAESESECRMVEKLFDGKSYADVYDAAGLLTPQTLLAHGVHLDSNQRATLAARQSVVVHCPTANVFLRSGIMPRWEYQREGIQTSLASDIGAGTERSMPRIAQSMISAAKHLALDDPKATVPAAAEAWWQITRANADALGWTEIGRLEPGAAADMLVIQPDIAWRSSHNQLSTLLYCWDDRWLTHTLVRGNVAWSR